MRLRDRITIQAPKIRFRGPFLLLAIAFMSCRPPHTTPLSGIAPASAQLPGWSLLPQPRLVRFTWQAADGTLAIRGEGAARLAPPDSARVDLFLSGVLGRGSLSAILIGDSLRLPPGAMMTEVVPATPILWAALGRLALPSLPDTIIRISGDTIHIALGRPEQWRVTAVGNHLIRVERIDQDRIVESVDRLTETQVRYQSSAHRSLVLEVQQDHPAAPFDASIWRY